MMATLAELEDALRKADAAGATDDARQLADAIVQMRGAKPAEQQPSVLSTAARLALTPGRDLLAGLVRGAGSIGATLLAPGDLLNQAAFKAAGASVPAPDRRAAMDEALASMGADTRSVGYGVGKLGGEIAGTAGVGPALAGGARAAGMSPTIINALSTAGMRTGAAPTTLLGRTGDVALRSAAGGVVGGASAGLVSPQDAATGGAIGAALPPAIKAAGLAGSVVGKGARAVLPKASPEVAALAQRAQELGIDLPADRIVNSRPLNALAASLEYVPLSGRQATTERMVAQFNRALSRTFGQDSENVTQALRKAEGVLGGKFDAFLKANAVKFDEQLLNDLADVGNMAAKELDDKAASIIDKQIGEITRRGAVGEIDGQAAYNIKKTLDRIGSRNSTEAYYARELKRRLMDALNRSVGSEKAGEFALLRKQYGNMLDLQNLAPNGAEGGVSIGRIANMKNIGNSEVQELADIAGQFLKTRENPHGALQRLVLGGMAATAAAPMGGLPYLGATMAAGRGANAALNSQAARGMLLGATPRGLLSPEIEQALYRSLPVLAADQ